MTKVEKQYRKNVRKRASLEKRVKKMEAEYKARLRALGTMEDTVYRFGNRFTELECDLEDLEYDIELYENRHKKDVK